MMRIGGNVLCTIILITNNTDEVEEKKLWLNVHCCEIIKKYISPLMFGFDFATRNALESLVQ